MLIIKSRSFISIDFLTQPYKPARLVPDVPIEISQATASQLNYDKSFYRRQFNQTGNAPYIHRGLKSTTKPNNQRACSGGQLK